jgi:hypothetical protein
MNAYEINDTSYVENQTFYRKFWNEQALAKFRLL